MWCVKSGDRALSWREGMRLYNKQIASIHKKSSIIWQEFYSDFIPNKCKESPEFSGLWKKEVRSYGVGDDTLLHQGEEIGAGLTLSIEVHTEEGLKLCDLLPKEFKGAKIDVYVAFQKR